MQKKLTLKARQTNPDSPRELIREYQAVFNVLNHYFGGYTSESATPNDGISTVDRWTNVKKLLKRKT